MGGGAVFIHLHTDLTPVGLFMLGTGGALPSPVSQSCGAQLQISMGILQPIITSVGSVLSLQLQEPVFSHLLIFYLLFKFKELFSKKDKTPLQVVI